MSEYIAIPRRRGHHADEQASGSSSSSYSSSPSASPQMRTPQSNSTLSPSHPIAIPSARSQLNRRPSMLSSSLSRQEHTVVNVGHPDGPPRLITCVKASQGFDWNQEIFLPSYADYEYTALDRKKDPVHEIVLTDAEARALFPE